MPYPGSILTRTDARLVGRAVTPRRLDCVLSVFGGSSGEAPEALSQIQ
jgi:hypothetical protein